MENERNKLISEGRSDDDNHVINHQKFGQRDRGSISVNPAIFNDPNTEGRKSEAGRPSTTFVAIDLYGQDRSEYIYSSFILSLVQVPILLAISELILVQKTVSSYEVAYGICLL